MKYTSKTCKTLSLLLVTGILAGIPSTRPQAERESRGLALWREPRRLPVRRGHAAETRPKEALKADGGPAAAQG